MGSRAMASSTRWSSPPERAPIRLSRRASPWTRLRQAATRSRSFLGMGRKTGQSEMAEVKRSSTLTGSPRSKEGDWGT